MESHKLNGGILERVPDMWRKLVDGFDKITVVSEAIADGKIIMRIIPRVANCMGLNYFT